MPGRGWLAGRPSEPACWRSAAATGAHGLVARRTDYGLVVGCQPVPLRSGLDVVPGRPAAGADHGRRTERTFCAHSSHQHRTARCVGHGYDGSWTTRPPAQTTACVPSTVVASPRTTLVVPQR